MIRFAPLCAGDRRTVRTQDENKPAGYSAGWRFTASFDEVLRGSGIEILRMPFGAPPLNGVERFARTVRSERLDRLLILKEQHLGRVLDVYVERYNGHRPHRALALTPPRPTHPPVPPATEWGGLRAQRHHRFGGVVDEYIQAA